MAHERRRALVWAGELLRELASPPGNYEEVWGGPAPPPKLRDWARRILRHYPEPWQIEAAVKNRGPLCWWIGEEPPQWLGLPIEPLSRNANKGSEIETGYTFDDYVSLAMHRAAVWLLIEEPSQVGKAQATLERWTEGGADPETLAHWARWRAILSARDWTHAIAETQDGKHLRRHSPLPGLLPKATSLDVSALVHAWRDRK